MANRSLGKYESDGADRTSSRRRGGSRPAGSNKASDRTCEDVVRIVLRGMCGYETVGDICQAEGISRREYNKWCRNFMEACKEWTKDEVTADTTAGGVFSPQDQQLRRLAIDQTNDIIERADDRLTAAWLINRQLTNRYNEASLH